MTPNEFKSRYIAALPAIPAGLDLSLDEFVSFPPERIATLRIPEADRRLLAEAGLPRDASPFLSFGLSAEHVLLPLDEWPESVMIGHNGSGDMVCLDQSASSSVVYYNHDSRMQRVFINSSLTQFAECLCLFAEFVRTKDAQTFTRRLATIDPAAAAHGAFWPTELQCVIESE